MWVRTINGWEFIKTMKTIQGLLYIKK